MAEDRSEDYGARLSKLLPAPLGEKLIYLDTAASTNDYAKELAREEAIVVADRQTAGRGRLGRGFESPGGLGIYLTLKYRIGGLEGLPPVTLYAAAAVCDAVESVCGVRPQIKWVNDLLIGGKKLCGVLTETTERDGARYLVIGVGLNVGQTAEDFSPGLREKAVSLRAALGRDVDRAPLARAIIVGLDKMYRSMDTDGGTYLERYMAGCINPGDAAELRDYL